MENSKEQTTKTLLEAGETKENIEAAFKKISAYFKKLNNASKDEMLDLHEQEIVHRIIVIGQKTE